MSIIEIAILLIVGAGLLIALQTALAVRHDHERSIAGPRESLTQIEARLEAKKIELSDVEEDLRKRREMMASIADEEAKVDALARQRDDLLTEWAQLEERRQELTELQRETDDAWQEYQEAQRDLTETQTKLEAIKERLDRADDLDARIRSLTDEQERLTAAVDILRTELSDLTDTRERAERIRQEVLDLERDLARLTGDRDAARGEAERLKSENAMSQIELSTARAEGTGLAAELATARQSAQELDERVRSLEARKAHLQRETSATGDGPDRLGQLKELPEVLTQLAEWPEWSPADEAAALRRVEQRIGDAGLNYHRRTIHAFHTAMKVNLTTQMAVLAGVSGTGKSQLPRQYALGMGIGFLQVPVQPRWDSPQDLMGFYNYIEGRFRPTDMARALYNLDVVNGHVTHPALQDRMLMILLDEMNLACVEYYFSDFLSRLESRPAPQRIHEKAERKDAEIELEIPATDEGSSPRIFPGYNLLFAGTMNEDESTQALSDKVVDRANIMRFPAPLAIPERKVSKSSPEPEALSRARWERWVRPVENLQESDRVRGTVDDMLGIMRDMNRPFGHRLGNAMIAYVANYPDLDGVDILTPLADQVEMRLLPKLRGVDTDRHSGDIEAMARLARDDLGDMQLADAINTSLSDASSGTGSFIWRGVSRV